MAPGRYRRRATGAILLLAAVLAAAGGFHNHADLARLAAAGFGPAQSGRVLSSHSPLESASHWHAVIRVQDHACLACHLQRLAAAGPHAHGAAPATVGHFVSHAVASRPALVLHSGDPTRGPPSLS